MFHVLRKNSYSSCIDKMKLAKLNALPNKILSYFMF